MMRNVASLLKERVKEIAPILTQEQGKPLQQSKAEISLAVDIIDWFAEDGIGAHMGGLSQHEQKVSISS